MNELNSLRIVENIRMLCQNHGITTSYLEKHLDLSPGLISRWSKAVPSLDRLLDIAQYFDVTIDELIGNSTLPAQTQEHISANYLDVLLNRTSRHQIDWHILDASSTSADYMLIGDAMFSILDDSYEHDCYYFSFKDGFCILVASFLRSDPALSL